MSIFNTVKVIFYLLQPSDASIIVILLVNVVSTESSKRMQENLVIIKWIKLVNDRLAISNVCLRKSGRLETDLLLPNTFFLGTQSKFTIVPSGFG